MKMKAVCEQTGLSDRAVRFYMEEKLIAPSYTENYLGRKTFDFSEENVKDLQDIAVLRKFGFSIDEIRQLQENPGSSAKILPQIRARKQKLVEEEQEALSALIRLDDAKAYGVSELAQALSVPAAERILPAEDQEDRLSRRKKLRILAPAALAILPVLLPWFWFNWKISHWSGLSLMRWPFWLGFILIACILVAEKERHAAFLRLAGTAAICAEYALTFVCFQERTNISGRIDLAASMRVAHWPFWAACGCVLLLLISSLMDCIALLRKNNA